jgi:hypothetical protein
MERESIISWTPTNWITVVLMVGIAYAIVGFGVRVIQQKRQNAGGAS